MTWLEQVEVVGTVAAAMLLGGLIGVDRQVAGKPAGLRTLMLVAGAAALFISLGDPMLAHYTREGWLAELLRSTGTQDLIRSDPIRIVEAVVTGVSFLGAGTIIRGHQGEHVQGLTTAAAILFVAALGIAVALHQWVLALGGTALALVALRLLRVLEQRVFPEG
jgi:putative Mg2+ transporter-C (MgtC) family protein